MKERLKLTFPASSLLRISWADLCSSAIRIALKGLIRSWCLAC